MPSFEIEEQIELGGSFRHGQRPRTGNGAANKDATKSNRLKTTGRYNRNGRKKLRKQLHNRYLRLRSPPQIR